MAMASFHIELRVANVDTPERMKAIRRALQMAGASLHAKTTLILADAETEIELIMRGQDFDKGDWDIPAQEEGDAA